jgi:hypothetical protein
MQKPPSGHPGNDRDSGPGRPILRGTVARSSDVGYDAESIVADHPSSDVATTLTVGIHAVTKLTQSSEKRPDGLTQGQSEDTSACRKRKKADMWKGTEEEELKRLVGIHTGPKGLVSWVKVVEAWNSQELPARSKASLSSRWHDIKSRVSLLNPISVQSDASVSMVSSGTTDIIAGEPPVVGDDTAREVNNAEVSGTQDLAPSPVGITQSPQLGKREKGCLAETVTVVFKKNLKKSRMIGCQTLRKPPKRVSGEHLKPIISTVNDLMREEICRKMNDRPSWNQLSILVYAGAMTVSSLGNQAADEKRKRTNLWFSKSYSEVDSLRKIIGKATAELDRRRAEVAPTGRQLSNIRLLEKKYKCTTFVEITSLVERLKCRTQLLLSRIALRKADEDRFFVRHSPTKMIFRDKGSDGSPESANVHQIRRFWKKIVGVKKSFEKSPQLVAWQQALPEHPEDGDLSESLSLDLWQRVVAKLKPWKACGPDGLQSFWWKVFTVANISLYKLVHHHLTSGAHLPQGWITDGRIVLLYKSGPRSEPSNFRPIACLNTCYKLLTGFVTGYLYEFFATRNVIAEEQRALRKGVWGCTHALLLDQTLIADAFNQKQRPISVGWIDYAKAFDTVPHTYIQWLFRVLRIPASLRTFLKGLMQQWRVKYEVKDPRGKVERSSFLRIRSGVLQGDSFSPLLFCLAMVPISHALNSSKLGYKTASGKLTKTQFTLSHQFYMDDLKLYAASEENLTGLIRIVKAISSAISMKINPNKCAVKHFIPKRMINDEDSVQAQDDGDIQNLEGGRSYKYLGIEQEFSSSEFTSWDRAEAKTLQCFQRLWSSDLTFRQKVEGHNSTLIPALTYITANIVKGGGKYDALLFKGEQLDKKLRRILVEVKARYKASAKSRLYLTPRRGGYGLRSVRDSIEESTIYTWAYLCTRVELRASYTLFEKMANRSKRSVLSDARHVLKAYNIRADVDVSSSSVRVGEDEYVQATLLARHVVELMRNANNTRRYEEWKELRLAGRVLRSEQGIDCETSFAWLRKGWLASVGVRNVIAAQEGCLLTRNHPACKVGLSGTDCRMCKGSPETVEHVISCCPKWLPTLYIDRHDSVARNIYYILCRQSDLVFPHYSQKVESVQQNERMKLYWNQPVQTRSIVRHNKPDLIAFDKIGRTALIVEVAVSWFTCIARQIEVKRNRYCVNGNWEDELTLPYPRGDNLVSDLSARGWKVTFLPVVIGATGEVLSDLKEKVSVCLGLNGEATMKLIERLQRSAVLGTSRVVRNHLCT